MVATIEITEDDRNIQLAIKKFVQQNNGKVDLLDIANHVSRQHGFSRQRTKEWTILLINEGILQDGPSRMLTIGKNVHQ